MTTTAPQKIKKRQQYTRDQFSDKEVYNEIKDEIKLIRDKNLKQVEQDLLINKLYEDKKRQTKIQSMQNNKELKPKVVRERNPNELIEQDEEQGEIKKMIQQKPHIQEQEAPTITDLAEHIRPITLTRNKLTELLKSRKFEQIIKGCFVRYKSQNSNNYLLAIIIGLIEGDKQYQLNNSKIKTLLRLQQSSSEIIKLSLDHVSNKHPPGNLEIEKWQHANKSKIPKQKQFKDKIEQLNALIHGKVSSEDIDRNLLFEAQKAAHDKSNGVYKISELIFFMKNHIHDISVTLEELEGMKDTQDKIAIKSKEKKECDEILNKLAAKQAQARVQKVQTEKQQKKQKSKAYTAYTFNDRKQDKIKQVWQKRFQLLCSYEGSNKIREELQQAHQSFDIDIDI